LAAGHLAAHFFGGFLAVAPREDVIDIIDCFGDVIPALSRIQPTRVCATREALRPKDLGWLDSGSRPE